MRKMDKDGLFLCTFQGNIFVKSLEASSTSSEIFIRRFMYSRVSNEFDTLGILDDTISLEDAFILINEEYTISYYGKVKYNEEVLFWIGYIYRYFAYTYELTSRNVYKIIKPKELNELYYVYHTFDPSVAISRILEEKGISFDYKNQNEKLLEMLKERKYEIEMELKEINEFYFEINYDEEVVGNINLSELDDKSFDLNIKLNDKYESKEFLKILIQKLFKELGLKIKDKSIIFKIESNNNKKIDLFETFGFSYLKEDENYVFLVRKV